MKDFFGRLSSRKFLLTIAGIVLCTLYPESSTPIVTLIGLFVGAEGAADTVGRYSTEKTAQTAIEQRNITSEVDGVDFDDVDKNSFTAGSLTGDLPL